MFILYQKSLGQVKMFHEDILYISYCKYQNYALEHALVRT